MTYLCSQCFYVSLAIPELCTMHVALTANGFTVGPDLLQILSTWLVEVLRGELWEPEEWGSSVGSRNPHFLFISPTIFNLMKICQPTFELPAIWFKPPFGKLIATEILPCCHSRCPATCRWGCAALRNCNRSAHGAVDERSPRPKSVRPLQMSGAFQWPFLCVILLV